MLKRIGTVRAVTTAVATLFVAIALVVGAVGLIAALRHTLIGEVEEVGRSQAREVAQQLEAGRPPILEVASSDEQLIQVITPAGAVAASSPNVAGRPAVAQLRAGESARVVTHSTTTNSSPSRARADFGGPANGRGGPSAGRGRRRHRYRHQIVHRRAAVLLVVVAVTTWITVGRALAPVEAIRREVDEISAAQLHRRVPEPATEDEIGRLATTMNRMLARLEDARNSQRRFVSDASHELRSPITTIRQHAEVALAHPDRANAQELAEVVLIEQQRMQRLVDDLLLLARADERIPLARASVDLDDLALEEARRLRSATSVEVDTTGLGAARVHGDVDALRRVLRNLGDNAARHASSRIAIAVAERGGDVLLTVDDDGPGIPESERARVLERFVRIDEARSRDDGGSGLGLAIVDEVVRAHGGAVSISRSPLGGARIGVTLPAEAGR